MNVFYMLARFFLVGLLCCRIGYGHAANTKPHAYPNSTPTSKISSNRIVPKPNNLKFRQGYFTFDSKTTISASSLQTLGVAQYWQKFFSTSSGIILPINKRVNPNSSVTFNLVESSKLGSTNPEAYRLRVNQKSITIEANSPTGLFYGVQSLRWMLPHDIDSDGVSNNVAWRVAAVDIADEPRFSWRGMHLDVSRSFMPVWFIKRYLDLLALHKMNRFHWHLTDDQGWRMPIDALPLLTKKGAWRDKTVVGHTLDKDVMFDEQRYGGFYSKADIRDVVSYAQERHITVIPEIDIPGHASALLNAYPEYGCAGERTVVQPNFGIFLAVLCPTEKTFAMLNNVFSEVAELFPGPYIHIGGDEVLKDEWKQSRFVSKLMKRHSLTDYHQVQSYFISRVSDIVSRYDRKIIGWNEILDGGVTADATIMSWQGIKGGITAAKLGHDAIMTPFAFTYFDFYQSRSVDEPMAIHGLNTLRNTYSYNPMPDELKNTKQEKHILGVQGQLWTEYQKTPSSVEYMVLPRMSALAEVAWSEYKNKNWENFTERLSVMYERFSAMGLNYSSSAYTVTASAKKMGFGRQARYNVSFDKDIPASQIRYTINNSEPTATSALYQEPFTVAAGTVVRAKAQNSESGELYNETLLHVIESKAVGGKINATVDGKIFSEPRLALLVDGVSAVDQVYHADEWLSFYGKTVKFTIDLNAAEQVSYIELQFNPGKNRQMYEPSALILYASDNGKNWQKVSNTVTGFTQTNANLEFTPIKTRWLKIVAENNHMVLDRQTNRVESVPLLFNEIIVR